MIGDNEFRKEWLKKYTENRKKDTRPKFEPGASQTQVRCPTVYMISSFLVNEEVQILSDG